MVGAWKCRDDDETAARNALSRSRVRAPAGACHVASRWKPIELRYAPVVYGTVRKIANKSNSP